MYAKIHYEPPKGGAFAPPLPPLNPPLAYNILPFEFHIVVVDKTTAKTEQTYIYHPGRQTM